MGNRNRVGASHKKKNDTEIALRRTQKKQKRREQKHDFKIMKRKSQRRRHSTPKPLATE